MAISTPRSTPVTARRFHRVAGLVLGLFGIYLALTGLVIQYADMHALLTHAAETDPAMMAIRESIDGTPNYTVIGPRDYSAASLPSDFDFQGAMAKVPKGVRSDAGLNSALRFLEVRVVEGKPVGIAQTGDKLLRFDPGTGALLPGGAAHARELRAASLHSSAKSWHRMSIFNGSAGDVFELFNAVIALGLFCMIVTGLVLYFQQLNARRRAGLNNIFWSAGGWWRSLHRGVAIVAAIFLVNVSISGMLLSIDTVALGIYGMMHAGPNPMARFPPGMIGDLFSPLTDAKIPQQLATTLAAYRSLEPSTPIKVLRLRYFSGMPQGVILTGGASTRQLVFNAETGRLTAMTEPSYPYSGFPFGWQEHELMKKIHRGDAFGIPGRLMDVFAGLSLAFLSLSGLWMYVDLWRKRRRTGKPQVVWS